MSVNIYDSENETLLQLAGTTDQNRITSRDLLRDTVGWTGKNLLKRPYHDTVNVEAVPGSSVSRNGITFTVNKDGSVTANGTATAGTYFIFNRKQDWDGFNLYGERLKLKVYPVQDTVYAQLYNTDAGQTVVRTDAVSGNVEFTFPDLSQNTSWNISIDFMSGAVVDNVTFYSMLCRADEVNENYEEFHPSVEKRLGEQNILGAKNFLNCIMPTTEQSGVTATKGVTANGAVTYTMSGADTGSSGTQFRLVEEDALLEVMKKHTGEKFILSGCPAGGDSTNGYFLAMYFNFDTSVVSFIDTGNGVEVMVPQVVTKARIGLTIRHNATFDNTVFKPMLRLASDPDDTFVPYAKTNRELTIQEVYTASGIHIFKQGNLAILQFVGAKPKDIVDIDYAAIGVDPLYSMSTYQLRCDAKSTTLEINNGAVVNLGYYSSYGGGGGAYVNLMTDTEKSVYGTVVYVCK